MAPQEWRALTLGECVTFLSGGTPSKSNPAYWGGDVPWVSSKDMKVTYLYDSEDHLTESGIANGTRMAPAGTILLAVRGMALAKELPVVMTKRAVAFNQDLKALKCSSDIDALFLFCWIRGKKYEILGLADEAAHGTKRLQTDRLQSLPIKLPPLPTQRKIAAILSAYDDLIENNARRIAILEEMAQMLYREWFVHFRFPGHEGVRLVESELGAIPEGWEVKAIGETVETLGGSTPSTKREDFWEGGNITWFTPSDLTSAGTMFITDSSREITELGLSASSTRLFPAYSVMMTSRATVGVAAINTQEACTNQGFITCIPNEQVSAYQIYFWIAQNKDLILARASGATFKEINKTTFREMLIPVAPIQVSQQFADTIDPMGKQLLNLQLRNKNLRQTRDLLLPRLVSGELDVSELDIAIDP